MIMVTNDQVITSLDESTRSTDLTKSLVECVGQWLEDARKREVDQYWYGQMTALLDDAGIDIYALTQGQIKRFDPDSEL